MTGIASLQTETRYHWYCYGCHKPSEQTWLSAVAALDARDAHNDEHHKHEMEARSE